MYIGVDLGSTNIKAAHYDADMRLIDRRSVPVEYLRDGGFVEFDAEAYFQGLVSLLGGLTRENGATEVRQIGFTGQAESLIVLGRDGVPLMNAISWMDDRSTEECAALAARFSPALCEAVTGQQAVLPTWPATKILWLKNHRPEIFEAADCYMLLKDYIVYRLSGRRMADMSIATFTFYFNIYEKHYWREMLEAVDIAEAQLPPLAEPCTVAGPLRAALSGALGLRGETRINIGTLDHFAGMVGTGNTEAGSMTLSTGTVMALAAIADEPVKRDSGIAMHYGFRPDTHVLLPVVESGGVSLEWFRKSCMPQVNYDQLNAELNARGQNPLLFLPYLVGTNTPELDSEATGVFWGLRQEYDAFDMARAVMEGVAFVLRKNCENIRRKGTEMSTIIATGGGAKSAIWCQIQADVTGLPVLVPAEKEAACLGAAMIAAVGDGRYPDYSAAAQSCVAIAGRFEPRPDEAYERKYRRFCALYTAALKIADIH